MGLNNIKVAMSAFPSKICFYGCGNMGSAMLRGWLAAGVSPDTFHIVDPVAVNLPAGVAVSRASQEATRPYDVLVLGIKPQLDAGSDLHGFIHRYCNLFFSKQSY